MTRWAGATVAGLPPRPVGQTPSRRAKLGTPRKLRIAAAGTAGSLLGVATLVGMKRRWAPTRRGCGALICRRLAQTVCSTCGVRRSPRTNIKAVMTAMRRSSHSEALRMYHSSSYSFHRVPMTCAPRFMLDKQGADAPLVAC